MNQKFVMKIKFIFLVVFVNVFVCLQAQDKSLYKKEIFTVNNETLPYRILLPQHYDASKKYPLILVLHGAGERGNDNEICLRQLLSYTVEKIPSTNPTPPSSSQPLRL